MKQMGLVWGNEEGTILGYTMMALLVLTMVGMVGGRAALYELTLSGNDRVTHEIKYISESVTALAAQQFDQVSDYNCRDSDWVSKTRPVWFSRGKEDYMDDFREEGAVYRNQKAEEYTREIANWISGNSVKLVEQLPGFTMAEFEHSQFQVLDMGVPKGESLESGNNKKSLHNLLMSGLHWDGQKKCLVQIGYRRRF